MSFENKANGGIQIYWHNPVFWVWTVEMVITNRKQILCLTTYNIFKACDEYLGLSTAKCLPIVFVKPSCFGYACKNIFPSHIFTHDQVSLNGVHYGKKVIHKESESKKAIRRHRGIFLFYTKNLRRMFMYAAG